MYKKQRHYFVNKGPPSQSYDFFPVVMYGCESWTIKIAEWQRIDAFELWCWRRLLRFSVRQQEIKPVNPEGNQSWIFFGRTDAEASILWPPDVKADSLEKTLMLGKIEGRGRRGRQRTRWLIGINGHEFEQVPGDGEGQGSLVCCSSQGCRVQHDWLTEQQKQQS